MEGLEICFQILFQVFDGIPRQHSQANFPLKFETHKYLRGNLILRARICLCLGHSNGMAPGAQEVSVSCALHVELGPCIFWAQDCHASFQT